MKIKTHKFRNVLIVVLANLLISSTIFAQIKTSTKKASAKQINKTEQTDSVTKKNLTKKQPKELIGIVKKESEIITPQEEAIRKKKRKREHDNTEDNSSINIYPNTFKQITTYPHNSHLGSKVHSEGVQGLAHSPTNWYWTRASWKMTKDGRREESYIYKMRANHMSRRVSVEGVPGNIWRNGWHHLSDPDYYKGYLYVPIEKGKNDWVGDHDVPDKSLPPLILVYDEDLNFLGSAPLSFYDSKNQKSMTSGGAWCAINPTDGFLYVSRGSGRGSDSNFSVLDAYEPFLDVNAETQGGVFRLYYRHSVKLKFNNNWNAVTYIQGGAFSPDGLFYYVMDPKHKYDLHSQSGVHVFEINEGIGTEITVRGKEINVMGASTEIPGKIVDHLSMQYGLPSELEGLDYVSPNEPIYKILLNNMRDLNVPTLINDTDGTTTGFLLLTRLYNDFGREDTVNLVHYQLINRQ